MRKWLIGGGIVIALALAGFFGLAPAIVERSMNRVEPVAIG